MIICGGLFDRVNLDNTTFEFILTLPKLEFVGKYNVKMRILIDFAGAGDMNGIFGEILYNP